MARIENATLTPTKAELISPWLPTQPWFTGDHREAEIVGAYRFDDPEGEVGVEIMLVRAPGAGADTWQVPLSYRNAPLSGGDDFLIGTLDHSVLGKRFVYNAIGDPVYRSELARVIAQADTEVPKFRVGPDGPIELPIDTRVQGSGTPEREVPEFWAADITDAADADGAAVIDSGLSRLFITRKIGGAALTRVLSGSFAGQLAGHWPGQDEPVPLAALVVGTKD